MGTTSGNLNTVGAGIRLKPKRIMTDWLKAFSAPETASVGVSVEVMIWFWIQPLPQINNFH